MRAAERLPAHPDPVKDLPELYGMVCVGDCMAPEIPDGSKVAASRSTPFKAGDLVVVWLVPEFLRPGALPAMVKRLAEDLPPWVRFPYREHPSTEIRWALLLSMNSAPDHLMVIPCERVAAIHAVIGVMPAADVAKPGACYQRANGWEGQVLR